MGNEIRKKSRSKITAQAGGTALTGGEDPNSGSYTGGAATPIDNTYSAGTENGLGADLLQLRLDVTSAPAASNNATAAIWWRGKDNGDSGYTKWKYSHPVSEDIIHTTADFYDAGLFALSYDETELKVVSNDYAFTATLYATPKLMEIQ